MGKKRARPALRVVWSKRENDIVVHFDKRPSDGCWFLDLIGVAFQPGREDFKKALRERGFDPETFRCSVQRLPEAPAP